MKKILLVSAVCLVSIVSLLSGCINVPMDDIMQFSIFSFEVDPGVINPGQSANLSWVVFGATMVRIDNGIGNVALSGHQIIFPEQTTTYTLTAWNETLMKNASVVIYVRNETPSPPLTPQVSCITDSITDRVTIVSADPGVHWADVEITIHTQAAIWQVFSESGVALDLPNQTDNITTNITAGDYIHLSGTTGVMTVSMRYIPSNVLIGVWTVEV